MSPSGTSATNTMRSTTSVARIQATTGARQGRGSRNEMGETCDISIESADEPAGSRSQPR
jgi:hypothetical protein